MGHPMCLTSYLKTKNGSTDNLSKSFSGVAHVENNRNKSTLTYPLERAGRTMGNLCHADQTQGPAPRMGRPCIDPRKVLEGTLFRLRTGCQLPQEFGDDVSIQRTLQRWEALGLFDKLWALLLSACHDLDSVDWQWQAADAQLAKARGVPKKGARRSRRQKSHRSWSCRRQEKPACRRRQGAARSHG